MDDEIKDMEGQTPEEEIQGQDSHSDYKPADRLMLLPYITFRECTRTGSWITQVT